MSESIILQSKNRSFIEEFYTKKNIDLSENNPDLLYITTQNDKRSIGIDQAKKIRMFLAKKPLQSRHKFVIIENAHLLTDQAQNAILKILEEPPIYGVIILQTFNSNKLLPTIVSRCKKIISYDLEKEVEVNEDFNFNQILALNLGERLEVAEKLSKLDRNQILEVLENFIQVERENLLNEFSITRVNNLTTIIGVHSDLSNTNVSARFALENLFNNING